MQYAQLDKSAQHLHGSWRRWHANTRANYPSTIYLSNLYKSFQSKFRRINGKLVPELIKYLHPFSPFSYELILSRLIKHTDTDHPDQKPLQEALKLVHDILMFLNCKEKEALENGQRETALRELEGVIEGMNDLVTPDRAFLLFDLVSMPSGQATRKERGFFLFNDLLVITSIKRRSGTIRKTNM